jgi:hypothetical protein
MQSPLYIFSVAFFVKNKSGVEGFEPPNGRIKSDCLSTWLHPIFCVCGSIVVYMWSRGVLFFFIFVLGIVLLFLGVAWRLGSIGRNKWKQFAQ